MRKIMDFLYSKGYIYPNVHSSIVYNSQDIEAT